MLENGHNTSQQIVCKPFKNEGGISERVSTHLAVVLPGRACILQTASYCS